MEKPKKHWYRFHVGECPICGKDKSFKERIYGEKPKDHKQIYIQIPNTETYDYCMER